MSGDEQALQKEMFTANGFLPELRRRRKAYDFKLGRPPSENNITVRKVTPKNVKMTYHKIDTIDEETDDKE